MRACALVACALLAGACSSPAPKVGAARPAPRPAAFTEPVDLEGLAAAGEWSAVLLALRGREDNDAHRRLAEQAADSATFAELEALWPSLQGTFPGATVAFRLGLVYEHSGRHDDAVRHYAAVVSGPWQAEAEARRTELEARRVFTKGRVAVLLPLSGPHRAIGEELKAAIEIYGERGRGVELVFLDTAGDRARAAARVDEAAHSGAAAILGPVGDAESRAAARRAVELGIPIAVLSPGATSPGPGVFRLVHSPEWEARAAAKVARLLGFKTAAVLAPRDEHGEAAARSFAQVARGLGVRVVASGFYDPTATELEPDLKSFFGLDPKTNERLRQHLRRHGKDGWKSFSPDIDYELLFVPDHYRRASLVASYLPYFSIEPRTRDLMNSYALRRKHGGRLPSVVQLLGTSSWHHPALVPAGGNAIEGALLIDVFLGNGDGEDYAFDTAAQFAEAYERRTGRPPSALAAQARDAAALVAEAVASAPDRATVLSRLARARIAEGACGPARVGPSREVERDPLVLRVEAGEFVLGDF